MKFVFGGIKKPVVLFALAAVILLAGTGTAALLGLFSGNEAKSAASVPEDTSIAKQDSTLEFSDNAVKITAVDSDSLGVSPDSKFKLVFKNAPEEKELASSLSVKPEHSFKLTKVSNLEYSMLFDKPLEKDSIYRFILTDKNTGAEQSWAFQTKKSINVIRTLPRDKANQVPVNTGIEITFSHEGIENPEKYFEITPKTGGRFELHKKTLVFVPEKLEEGTIYTVAVKSGIGIKGSTETLANDYSFSFQTQISEAGNRKYGYFGFSDTLYTFTPKAVPALQVYTDDSLLDKELSVELYSYPDAEGFLSDLKLHQAKPYWAMYNKNKSDYNEAGLEKSATVKARIIQQQTNYWYQTFLLLPSTLPEGYYLAKTELDGQKYYTQFQINKASVYILATKDKTLAWLNDSTTGKPLTGAEFLIDEGNTEKADKDGMAVLNVNLDPSSTETSDYYFIVRPVEGLAFIAQVGRSNQPYYDYYNYGAYVTDDYWTYIYLDKGIYLPQDTINVWGIIKPRDGSRIDTEAVLELVRYDYSEYYDNNVSVLVSKKVGISQTGTFTGSLGISNFNPGSYEVRLRINDKTMMTNYLQVMEYTKPAYKLEVNPDRSIMYAWEKVNFNIKASFFEGTPVAGIKLDYNANLGINDQASGSLVSDKSGISSVTLQPSDSEPGWRPFYLTASFTNNEGEEQQINEYSHVTVFPKDTMIETESGIDGDTGNITISTSRIDLGKLAGGTSWYYQEDEYRGPAVDIPLTAKLYEKHYEARKTGEYYDYINKVKRNTYEHNEVQNLIQEYSFNTVSGKYRLTCNIDKDKNYYLEVYGKDSAGRPITETCYLYSWNYYSPYNTSTYSISDENMYKQFRQDEKVSVEVRYNKEAQIESKNRRYLFIRLKNGVLDYNVTDSNVYDFVFAENFIPNMYVKALCFDGINTYDAGLREYNYDREEKKLDISVKADKESYKPGDTVKLKFDVKDASGQPVSSEINVSAVDEAYFTISQQYVDTLSELYGRSVSSGILSDYLSYKPVDESGAPMAEGGEGGDMYVRKDFKDSALFTTVTSGSDGKAEASFKLPDNLTSWRITYQAVTSDLSAGNGKINIDSKLPFFVDTIFNKAFITGDNPTILLRAYGTKLPETAEVAYKVIISKDNVIVKSFEANGKANSTAGVSLDSLEAGNYTIRIEASSGNLKDAIERSFKVTDSLLETAVTDYVSLTDNTSLSNGANGLTSLVFYGEDSSLLYRELHSLYWSWGERLDQKLSRKLAGELLQKYFNEEPYFDEEFDIKKYQTEDGGLAILSYDSSSPELSAEMCSLAADYVDKYSLTVYFRKLLEDEKTMPEDMAYALWGLAALKEPVLIDIQRLLEADEAASQIRLILGAALAETGDNQGAGDIYREALEKTGRVTDTFAYIENGTRDESILATALCSLIALKINAPEKIKLFNYIKSNSTTELLVNLERMILVTNYIKDASLNSSFSYELDGARKKVDLAKGSSYRLVLTPEKLAGIKFSNVQGKVIAAVTYVVPVSEVRMSENSPAAIERTYCIEKNEGKGSVTSFNHSDTIETTITVKFNESAPDGYYEITDILPAGLRFVYSTKSNEYSMSYPLEVSGQKVVFGYYYNKSKSSTGYIRYYARAVNPGSFTADNAVIRHIYSNATGLSDKTRITVGD